MGGSLTGSPPTVRAAQSVGLTHIASASPGPIQAVIYIAPIQRAEPSSFHSRIYILHVKCGLEQANKQWEAEIRARVLIHNPFLCLPLVCGRNAMLDVFVCWQVGFG